MTSLIPKIFNHERNDRSNIIQFPFCDAAHYMLPDHIISIIMHTLRTESLLYERRYEKLQSPEQLDPEYLITVDKPNKIGAILFVTTIYERQYSVFVINGIIYCVDLLLDPSLYRGDTGTVFVGELAKRKRWTFYIGDILFYGGAFVGDWKLSRRLGLVNTIIKKMYRYDMLVDPCTIQMKGYFPYNHVDLIKKNCRLRFVSENNEKAYYCDITIDGRNKELQDLASQKQQFLVRKTNKTEVYNVINEKSKAIICILGVVSMETSQKLHKLFVNTKERVLSLKYSPVFETMILNE